MSNLRAVTLLHLRLYVVVLTLRFKGESKPEFLYIYIYIYNSSPVIQTNQLMLCREIIAACSEIHTKHVNTLCGQNVEFLAAFAKLRKATFNFVISVCPSTRNSSPPTVRSFVKFDTSVFFENLSRKFKFHETLTRITAVLYMKT